MVSLTDQRPSSRASSSCFLVGGEPGVASSSKVSKFVSVVILFAVAFFASARLSAIASLMLRAGAFGIGISSSGDARRTDFEGDLGIDLVRRRGVEAGELVPADGLEGDDAREREVVAVSVVLTAGRA